MNKFRVVNLLVLSLCLLLAVPVQAGELIRVPKREYTQDDVIIPLLRLALQKSGLDFTLQEIAVEDSSKRIASEASAGNLDIIWFGATDTFVRHFHPVRIPILKGLLGYRVLVIREGEQAKFDKIMTVSDLQNVTGGLGRIWGGVRVFKNAEIPLVLPGEDRNLWRMLNANRFDFVPLAIFEPWPLFSAFDKEGYSFAVENNLLLVYPHVSYFHVLPERKQLAEFIRKGLNAAIEDGSYNELLFSSELFQTALNRGRLTERRIIPLANPDLPGETPYDVKEYWIDVQELEKYKNLNGESEAEKENGS